LILIPIIFNFILLCAKWSIKLKTFRCERRRKGENARKKCQNILFTHTYWHSAHPHTHSRRNTK
jgi:hypothetical protein